jgi:hypothetical protein
MTNQLTAPEFVRSQQPLMLPELARTVALVHCQRRDEAVAVQDGEPPPAEWLPELETRRVKFANYELANALESIAVKWLEAPSPSWDFEAWKRCTPNWKRRIARARKEVRGLCAIEKRKIQKERTSSIIASVMADERTMQTTQAIRFALRAAMMSLEAAVRATSDTGERRKLDRAEIAEASIDHLHNTLEIRGRVWCGVEVECKPPKSAAPLKPKSKRVAPVEDQTVMTWLKDQIGARRKKNEDTIRPTMIWLMRDRFRAHGLTRKRAGKIYAKLPKPYKGTPGPSPKSNTD